MSGFLYFLPELRSEVTEEILHTSGVAYAIERHDMAGPRFVTSGPGSKNGLLVAHKSMPLDRLLYSPAAQEWMQIPKATAWVGKWADDDIKPSALQRPELVEGESITLENGTKWKAAYARRFRYLEGGDLACFCPLPKGLSYTEHGWRADRIAKRFRRLAELASLYWSEMCAASREAENEQFTFLSKYADELAVAALTANYRIGGVELTLLDAYSETVRQNLINIALDQATIAAWQKKNCEPESVGTVFFDGPLLPTLVG